MLAASNMSTVHSSEAETQEIPCKKQATEHVPSSADWELIKSYFAGQPLQRLVRHQRESYNNFVSVELPKTIEMFNPVRIKSEHDYQPESGKYRLEMSVTFDTFRVQRPEIHENNGATKLMFPQEARVRNFTYAAPMSVSMNIKYVIRSGDTLDSEETLHERLTDIPIGRLPIMLRSSICLLEQYSHLDDGASGECCMDPGGYFIINGSEKTCLGQERAAENQVQCFKVSKSSSKWLWMAEVKSVPEERCISPKQVCMYLAARESAYGHAIWVQIPRTKSPIPLFVLYRALGVISDREICERILMDDVGLTGDASSDSVLLALKASIVAGSDCLTQEAAYEYITNHVLYTPMNVEKEEGQKRKRRFMMEILRSDLFPHCGTEERKERFLGYMANKLVRCSLGLCPPSDRDSYTNKRIDLAGTLLNNLFRNYFNKLVKDMQKQIVREINSGSWRATENYRGIVNSTNVYKVVKAATVENGFRRALATGDFGIKQTTPSKVGVAQVLNRLTYISSLSHLRRVNTPIDKSGKLVPPRQLHGSSWGFLCPAETPEGGSVGVVKNLSYMTHITVRATSHALHTYVSPFLCGFSRPSEGARVLINGAWVGWTGRAPEMYADLKLKKRQGLINVYTSVVFDRVQGEIRLCNDAGRVTRPLLCVEGNRLTLSSEHLELLRTEGWDRMLIATDTLRNAIEYVDPDEQNHSLIAMSQADLTRAASGGERQIRRYTHREIHPSTIFGILASCIPFPEHNQAPRNTYQCAMGKQAMGMYVTNFDRRLDKTAYVLTYAMRPLVDTRLMNIINLHKIPSGCQVIVAIMSHTGYNQEDSILFNGGAIDRGLFQATVYHTEKDEDKKVHGDEEIRCRPDPARTKGIKFGNYGKLRQDGTVPENTLLENRDVIMGKVAPIREARNDHTQVMKYDDQSRVFRTAEECYVDKCRVDRNGDGYNCCKVKIRAVRKPTIGDKFSSRHGQKGTIGNVIPEADMPFMSNGLKPDIIINPHAIPSRMTIAQLKETLLGKALLELGMFGDGTSFGDLDIASISRELGALGYESKGNELLYNGLTGEQLETSIFVGPAFYQRLKHMVADKQHSRSIGPMVNLTRQPAEGRSRDGGLRYGEMERDCMCSHGAAHFNKARLYDASDAFSVHVCRKCGLTAAFNNEHHIHLCRSCGNRTSFAKVDIPYACKLLFQELTSMGVAPRLVT